LFLLYPGSSAISLGQPIPSLPLNSAGDLDTLLRAIGDARIVILGEASHGTSDYYLWRTAITRRLIEEKGFSALAVEGEWADCFRANEWIRGSSNDSASAKNLLQGFSRWPPWMWANREALQLLQTLQTVNSRRTPGNKIGFYGLDLYCVWESIAALASLRVRDTSEQRAIRAAYQCFSPFGDDAMNYARAIRRGNRGCSTQANQLIRYIEPGKDADPLSEEQFARQQYAHVVYNGERYFRNINTGAAAWNIREHHMLGTVQRILGFYGPRARIIIWAHNTHAGDARASTMSARHKLSLGQLLRQTYGEEQVFITGFGSHSGTVLAGRHWGDSLRMERLPPARGGSWEELLHTQYGSNRYIPCKTFRNTPALNGYFNTRAVGVVYRPAEDAYSSYTPSVMARRYDAFIFLDRTSALHPLPDIRSDTEASPAGAE
jgi:erythromycin esterase-like protein